MLKIVDGFVICCGCDHFYGQTGRVMAWACAHTRSARPAQPCECECHTVETESVETESVETIWGLMPLGYANAGQ